MFLRDGKLSVKAVVFDLDGTLIDSIGAYFKIMDKICERLSLPSVSRKTLIAAMTEGKLDWDLLFPDLPLPQKETIIKRALDVIKDVYPSIFLQEVKLIPGADKILRQIADAEKKIGLVTSTHQKYIKDKLVPLAHAGVDSLFETIITIDDAPNVKPAADPLLLCIKRLNVTGNKSVYVGDLRTDIRAGKAAGMQTIGVLTGIDDLDGLKNEQPNGIIKSVADLHRVICFKD